MRIDVKKKFIEKLKSRPEFINNIAYEDRTFEICDVVSDNPYLFKYFPLFVLDDERIYRKLKDMDVIKHQLPSKIREKYPELYI